MPVVPAAGVFRRIERARRAWFAPADFRFPRPYPCSPTLTLSVVPSARGAPGHPRAFAIPRPSGLPSHLKPKPSRSDHFPADLTPCPEARSTLPADSPDTPALPGPGAKSDVFRHPGGESGHYLRGFCGPEGRSRHYLRHFCDPGHQSGRYLLHFCDLGPQSGRYLRHFGGSNAKRHAFFHSADGKPAKPPESHRKNHRGARPGTKN